MPWKCPSCASDNSDATTTCSSCQENKAAWTLVADNTRTFQVSATKRIEYFRGVEGGTRDSAQGYEDCELKPTEYAVATPKALAQRLAEEDLLPPSARVLTVRLKPKAKQSSYDVTLVVPFETKAAETGEHPPHDGPPPTLDDDQRYVVRFLFVYGPEPWPEELTFPGLHVVDVSEEDAGDGEDGSDDLLYAPAVEAAGPGRRKRKVLPLRPLQVTYRLRCRHLKFHPGSAKLLPSSLPVLSMALARLRDGAPDGAAQGSSASEEDAEAPRERLLILSHGGAEGDAEADAELAQARAESLLHVLMGDTAWLSGQAEGEHYTHRDVREVLRWAQVHYGWQCHRPGPLDDPAEGEAILAFEEGTQRLLTGSLEAPSETLDDDFWTRVQALYANRLTESLELPDLGALDQTVEAIEWLHPDFPAVGTGDRYPAPAAEGSDDSASDAPDPEACGVRTELLFFPPREDQEEGETQDDAPEHCEDAALLADLVYGGRLVDLPCPCDQKPWRFACSGARFNAGSAVLLPGALSVLERLLLKTRETPKARLLVSGHGPDPELALARAQSVAHVLQGDHEGWSSACADAHSQSDLRAVLKWAAQTHGWPCDPGPLVDEAPAEGLVLAFGEAFRASFGVADPIEGDPSDSADAQFWLRVLALYGHQLRRALGLRDLAALDELVASAGWADPAHPAIACSDVLPPQEGDWAPPEDGVSDAPDPAERIECLLIPVGQVPAPQEADDPSHLEALYSGGPEGFHELDCACQEETLIGRLACAGLTFHPGSPVLLPKSLGTVAAAIRESQENPSARLQVVAHGPDEALALARAQSLIQLALGDADAWAAASAEAAGDDDVRSILVWAAGSRGWDCAPPEPDASLDDSLVSFHRAYERSFVPPAEREDPSQAADEGFWRQTFVLYAHGLAALLGQSLFDLDEWTERVTWVDPAFPAVVVTGAEAGSDSSDSEGADSGAEAPGPCPASPCESGPERVEVLYFEPGEAPVPLTDEGDAYLRAPYEGPGVFTFEELPCACGASLSAQRLACQALASASTVPSPEGLLTVAEALNRVRGDAEACLLVVGHGGAGQEQAEAMYHLVTGNVSAWCAAAEGTATDEDVRRVLTFAARPGWPCAPRSAEGKPADAEAIAAFTGRFGAPTAEVGELFWQGAFSLYSQRLAACLGLPGAAELDELVARVAWAHPPACSISGVPVPSTGDSWEASPDRVEFLVLEAGAAPSEAHLASLYEGQGPPLLDCPCSGQVAAEAEAPRPSPKGQIHAALVHPYGYFLGEATLSWQRDGAPVTEASLGAGSVLPTRSDDEGTVLAKNLPWGSYTVKVTHSQSGAALAQQALPLTRHQGDVHVVHLRFASKPPRRTLDKS